MLTLWVFFRHPCWHIVNIAVICQENWTWKIFLPLTDTWLFFLQFHCSTAPWSTLTENKKKKARRIKRYQKKFTVDGCTRNSILQFSLATNFHSSPQWRYSCCSTFPQSPGSITLLRTALKVFHTRTNILLPGSFFLCSARCAVHFCMHFLALRFHSYYNFCLTLVLLKDHTNMPTYHKQVKLCHRKYWCLRDSNNTTTSLGDKLWIDKRRYSRNACSHLKISPG